jgi:hypothetical protein
MIKLLFGRLAYVLSGLFLFHTGYLFSQQEVYFFRESNQGSYYDSGLAFKSGNSFIEQAGATNDKIPVEFALPAYQGKHSLRINWISRVGGDWSALIIAPGFPFLDLSKLDTLSFAVYSKRGLAKANMPYLYFEGAPGTTKSKKFLLSTFIDSLPAEKWQLVSISIDWLKAETAGTTLQWNQIKAVILGQNIADNEANVLLVDEVKAFKAVPFLLEIPDPVKNVRIKAYPVHLALHWQIPVNPVPAQYKILRSSDQWKSYTQLPLIAGKDSMFMDYPSQTDTGIVYSYKILALNSQGAFKENNEVKSAQLATFGDEAYLDMVQEYTFRYFWDFAHPVSGMARERNTSGHLVTTGGSGMGIMALLSGMERGFITRKQGMDRFAKILTFLESCDRFKGVFPHWLNGETGKVIPFSSRDDGGDLVETAFLMQGLLAVRGYLNLENTAEKDIRDRITKLWEAIDWQWYRQLYQNVLYWHWSPNHQFTMNFPIRGWNEALITYILAIAAPVNPIPANMYHVGWAGANYTSGLSSYGYRLDIGGFRGGPLFFAHYSFLGFDPRDKRDAYTDYFRHNTNHTLINRAYAIQNPKNFKGYGENCWGLTASDDPVVGYLAHEPTPERDNGTIAPTAALSSIVYTPKESIAALKHFYHKYGKNLFGPMGFYDAFNLERSWFADSYLAIDQGPIMVMIENYRSGKIWQSFMKNPEIDVALERIGFSKVVSSNRQERLNLSNFSIYPNPVSDGILHMILNHRQSGAFEVSLLSPQGQMIHHWGKQIVFSGENAWTLQLPLHLKGNYLIRITSNQEMASMPIYIH